MLLILINSKESNKLFSAFHAEELKKIWTSDVLRDWELYVKYPKFEDWSSWNSASGGNK
jgi:hypothetical protein